jgi:uncharacterized membrane protein
MSTAEATGAGTSIPFGPVQMLVVGFPSEGLQGKILPELKRLQEADVVRLIDLVVVKKDEDGEIETLHTSDLESDEAIEFGALVGALVGLGTGTAEGVEEGAFAGAAALEDGHLLDDESVWFLSDAIPAGTAAAIALIEHRWAIPLRDKIIESGGIALADEWIHPADLVAAGRSASRETGAVGS